jgi:Ni,Fe-hydrogenase III small subunit/formate hydrogenlyase subunit 6/NADH:ubiquinone oxidoreductase subunit I
MINIIKKFIKYGVVTVDYPNKPITGTFMTGRPEVDSSRCDSCKICIEKCPTGAIVLNESIKSSFGNGPSKNKINFNLDECIFCSNCEEVCPKKAIKMSSKFELAKKSREELSSKPIVIEERNISDPDYEIIGIKLKEKINKYFGRSLHIREVDAGSCNGCDNEINALNGPYNDIERFGIQFVASPRHADMLLVTGPASRNMELALIKTYNATPDPKLVVAVGACACSGGIFKDSYATRNGIDCIIGVDVYIPGCPPRPQALIYGILKAIEKPKKV